VVGFNDVDDEKNRHIAIDKISTDGTVARIRYSIEGQERRLRQLQHGGHMHE
jgi:hypothetical protein